MSDVVSRPKRRVCVFPVFGLYCCFVLLVLHSLLFVCYHSLYCLFQLLGLFTIYRLSEIQAQIFQCIMYNSLSKASDNRKKRSDAICFADTQYLDAGPEHKDSVFSTASKKPSKLRTIFGCPFQILCPVYGSTPEWCIDGFASSGGIGASIVIARELWRT